MPDNQLTKEQLKALAQNVVVAQGNVFIKELLRSCGAKLGTTKDDFSTNLAVAIDNDLLSQDMLEVWLAEIEGWGDQHLYLVEPPKATIADLAGGIAASPHAGALNAAASLDFPDELQLKHIILNKDGLSLVWHQRKEGWNRWRPKDFVEEEGLERYRFEAYRQRFDRSVIRYAWNFGNPYGAILIHRNTEIDHDQVFKDVRAALTEIGCLDAPFLPIPLNQAVKSAAKKGKGTHSARFGLDAGYVEVASTLAEGGIDAVEPVRAVLHSVDISKFDRAQGMLHFTAEEDGTSRRVAVQVYGSEARLRIWAQCRREDVSQILKFLWDYNRE
jgi:hypothetical protein